MQGNSDIYNLCTLCRKTYIVFTSKKYIYFNYQINFLLVYSVVHVFLCTSIGCEEYSTCVAILYNVHTYVLNWPCLSALEFHAHFSAVLCCVVSGLRCCKNSCTWPPLFGLHTAENGCTKSRLFF
jgi:hypothetical protein